MRDKPTAARITQTAPSLQDVELEMIFTYLTTIHINHCVINSLPEERIQLQRSQFEKISYRHTVRLKMITDVIGKGALSYREALR